MRKPAAVSIPAVRPIEQALDESAALVRLRERIDDSARRFEAIRPLLPGALAAQASPGPVDASGWTLLAANASVATKLRQLQPRLEQALREHGWTQASMRVRVAAAR